MTLKKIKIIKTGRLVAAAYFAITADVCRYISRRLA